MFACLCFVLWTTNWYLLFHDRTYINLSVLFLNFLALFLAVQHSVLIMIFTASNFNIMRTSDSSCFFILRIYSSGGFCTVYLHTCQVRVTIGDSGLCCCPYVLILHQHSGPCSVLDSCQFSFFAKQKPVSHTKHRFWYLSAALCL